jgi:hypothetical protein
MKKYLFMIAILTAFCLFDNCSETPPESSDPCAGKQPVTAEFEIYEQLSYDSIFVADTTMKGNVVYFIAKSNYYEYEWKIGTMDSVFTSKAVALRFIEPYNKIEVRLIVRSMPDTLCFPDDDGIDTLIKYLTVVPWQGGSALIGRYKGINLDSPLDTFVVEIGYQEVYENDKLIAYFYYVNNIPNGCISKVKEILYPDGNIKVGYRSIHINGLCAKYYPTGYGLLDKHHRFITFDYTAINLKTTNKQKYFFKGIKL